MWFKTRVGLSSVTEPFEIRVAKYPDGKHPSYLMFARSSTDSDVHYKGFLGTLKAPARYIYLARFHLAESSELEIAQWMRVIEDAIANGTRICDLSAAGQADVWTNESSEACLIRW